MRIYCPNPFPGNDVHPLFFFRFAPERAPGGLFREHLPENFFQAQEYVDRPEQATIIVLPNNFVRVTAPTHRYISHHAEKAHACGIPIFAFSCGDFSDSVRFDPRVRVLRYSLYGSARAEGDIATPTLAEDLGKKGIALRHKRERPAVSFCGRAAFASLREMAASSVRKVFYQTLSLVRPSALARVRGIYWRRWAIEACAHSPLVSANFIVRKTFSGALRTIEIDPARARQEFIKSMIESDFVLAPKGDGNYSNRFLEALSLGRIPVLIDTDVVLPLEDRIDYSKIMVRVPMRDIGETPRYIRAFYDALGEGEWEERQRLARRTFEEFLRQDSFFASFFELWKK